MLLMDAKNEIDSRLSETIQRDYREHIPEYFDALEIARKCIEAQMRLADILNDWDAGFKEGDSLSYKLVEQILNEVWYEWTDDNI